MSEPKNINISVSGKRGIILLNRPEVHNALNVEMISEIRKAISLLNGDRNVNLLIFKGNGKSFCSGADLNYMKQHAEMDFNDNLEDSKNLARLFYEIYSSEKPVLTIAHGNIAGGANGIIAASDYAITTHDSVFRFSEVKLGLIPATIAPYVIDRIGRSRAMELMLSGRSFSGVEAEAFNLVNAVVKDGEEDQILDSVAEGILSAGPEALRQTRQLILELSSRNSMKELLDSTSKLIARARASEEGQEGMSAFFEKRKPKWINENL